MDFAAEPLHVAEQGCRASIVRRTGTRTILAHLRDSTRCTASLVALDGTRGIYVYRTHGERDGQREADMGLRAGHEFPLHCAAGGKALLAALKTAESKYVIRHLTLTSYTRYTVSGKEALIREVKSARRRGVAKAESEYAYGLVSIAAPVRPSLLDLVLAVELTLPRGHNLSLPHSLVERRCSALLVATAEISLRLYPPPEQPPPHESSAPKRKRLTPAEYDRRAQEMAILHEEKVSYTRIGERYGITRQAVEQMLKLRKRRED